MKHKFDKFAERWWNKNGWIGAYGGEEGFARDAWNKAITEAIRTVNNSCDEDVIGNLRKLKKS